MRDDEESPFEQAADAAIVTLQKAVRLYRQCTPDELSVDTERWFACWIAQILMDVDIDLERAVESLHDDNLTVHDDPFRVNAMRPERSPDQTNGGKKP